MSTNSISHVSPVAATTAREPTVASPATRHAKPPAQTDVRSQPNASIVASNLEVSIRAGNDSLALLYRTAIDRLNEILGPEFGQDAIQAAAGQDNTPEATAARIVSLSTGFFEAYKARNPDQDASAQLSSFMDQIRSGFEQGYEDARGILEGLGVFDGDIAAGIQKTHDLVLKGYADFVATQQG